MKIQQYYLACLSHASYMITDEATKTAAVVDPQRDIDQYLADARAGGYTIRHVFLTHFHADFIAGHIELRDRAGATIHLGRRAQAEFAYLSMKDGDAIEFGDVKLAIMETPGHTPEGISILVYDLTKSHTAPLAVLTPLPPAPLLLEVGWVFVHSGSAASIFPSQSLSTPSAQTSPAPGKIVGSSSLQSPDRSKVSPSASLVLRKLSAR